MSNYVQAISFGAKDVLTSTDPAKIILGANVDSELALIATAITSKLNTSDLAGNYTISGNITFTGTNVIPAAGLTGTVIDARLSANVPLLNVANNFTALQAITVADATYGLSVRGASGRVLLRPYVDATNGAVLESTNAAESLNLPLSILATTLRLSGSTSITLNGVNATDFARLSQSNTFTLANKFSGASIGSILLEDLSSPADEKLWRIFSSGSQFGVQSRTDANGAGANIITASRIGTTVTTLALAATALTLNGRDFGTSTLPALSGVNLTSLNASNLGSGTVPDARFPATLPALNGSALTALSASNISSGSLADARLSANIPLLNAANVFTNGTQKVSITAGNAQFEVKTTDAAGQTESKLTNSAGSWSAYMTAANTSYRLYDGTADRLVIANGGNFDFKGGTVSTNNASAGEVGYKGLPQNSQSVSYTTVLADCNKNLHQTGATKTFTIDSNANVAAPIGTVLNFTCDNATGVSIAITTDTLRLAGTATTGTRTLAQYGVASAIKILSTTWLISGQGLS